jgi:hypothetical protein
MLAVDGPAAGADGVGRAIDFVDPLTEGKCGAPGWSVLVEGARGALAPAPGAVGPFALT